VSEKGLVATVHVRLGSFELRAELSAAPRTVLGILGPNGSGKSTLLRALAGLVPASGRITVDGAELGGLPPQERRVGVVFQDYRLFPHLTVLDNVAFASRAAGARRRQARRDAMPMLDGFGLISKARQRPSQLSGGQAQRVALARALAMHPRMLLLDEPLSALDAQTRQHVRAGLQQQLQAFEGPALLVTHDPLEAMMLADQLLVLEDGRVVQSGAPARVARQPATEYVAKLVGQNVFAGVWLAEGGIVSLDGGGTLAASGSFGEAAEPVPSAGERVLVSVAPSSIGVHTLRPSEASYRNVWPGTVRAVQLLSDRVRLDVDGTPPVIVDVTPAAVAELALGPGRQIWLTAKATEVTAYASSPRG
jgi:molybdate transport system ATP-binding protein